MNRTIALFFSVLIFCLTSCKSQTNSKVISLIHEINENGEIQGKSDTLEIEYLDTKGNVFKKTSTRRFEDAIFIKTTIYNSKGRMVSQISDYGNSHVSRIDMIRDSNNFIIANKMYDLNSNDTSWTDFLNNYDKESRTLRSDMIIRNDSAIIGRYRTRFDQNNNIIEDTELDSSQHEITKNIYTYTSSGKLLKQTYYEKGLLISTTQYTYEGRKKIEAILTHNSKIRRTRIQFIYQ